MLTRLRRASVAFCFMAPTLLMAASQARLDQLESLILARYGDASPADLIQVVGLAQSTTEREGAEYFMWQISKQSGSFASGFGTARTHECRATFEFRNDRLTSVSLVGARRADRTLCEKLVNPLLTDTPRRAEANGATTTDLLTNSEIIKMTRANLDDDVIVAKIKISTCRFEVSPDDLVALKEDGVSDRVIQAMIEAAGKNS